MRGSVLPSVDTRIWRLVGSPTRALAGCRGRSRAPHRDPVVDRHSWVASIALVDICSAQGIPNDPMCRHRSRSDVSTARISAHPSVMAPRRRVLGWW